MAIDIKFDLIGNPEPPTIILANRNGNKLGQLNVNVESIELKDKFNDASEFSFTLNKYINDNFNCLWDKVVDFRLVYCKEWDKWFEISVELDEATETVKTVLCTQLGQAELSQIMLYDVEINTEKDIERDDYKISILYDENDLESSILNRLLKDKAPHYSIIHVDPTIAKIQRSFSFNDVSIYDAFLEIGEEIGCLFVFNSNSDKNGKIQRTISVYDLQQNCNDCGHRGEFTDKCPKCNGINIKNGYGEDTLIFVTSDELASSGIQLTTDTDSVKNCFKLEAGDDLMTATVRNCNPNGTDYIWRFSDNTKEDMSDKLVEKIESYDEKYKRYYNEYESNIDEKLLSDYNSLVDKYCIHNESIQRIDTPIVGYSSLMNAYYNVIDLELYLNSGLMPNVEMIETNAEKQVELLAALSSSPVAVTDITVASLSTTNNAVLAMAKVIVNPIYKIQIESSELIDEGNAKYWSGKFVVISYSDEEDTAVSEVITVSVNDDIETFVKQKIDKILNKENTDDLSISGLFEKEYDDFCNELKKYALNPLNSFHDACQSCIDILIEQGICDGNSWSDTDTDSDSESNLYKKIYVPYYKKLEAIESEIKLREAEISVISGIYDIDGNIISKGLKQSIEDCRTDIQNNLDFKNHLGDELWIEFCCYRREDKYSNENYISDGLNNAELFKKASEFFDIAENEIYKSSELSHSISTTLNNLLAIDKFKRLVDSFKVGNWIRIRIDDKIYKLRLLEYDIDFGNFDNISVEFSDVTKVKNGTTDVQSILSQASSMATSYNSIQRQASQGAKGNSVLNNWVENGLNATQTKIIDSHDENLMFGKNSFWCRQLDPITGEYSKEQIKIINSTIAITDDGWATTKTAIGKYYYIDPNTKEQKVAYGVNGETIVGKLLIGEQLDISNENGNLEFNDEGFTVKNDKNTVNISPSNESIFNIKNEDGNIFSLDDDGELVIVGNITAKNLTLMDGTTIEGGKITGLSEVAISGSYDDLKDVPTKLSDFINDNSFITKDVDNLSNYYNKTESDELLNVKANSEDLADVSTSGSYNDLLDAPTKVSSFENDANYLTQDNFDNTLSDAIDSALSEAKENGDFNGKDGESISHSWDGTTLTITSVSGTSSSDLKGDKGDSPIRGIDYWTDNDKTEIINAVLAELRSQGVIS